MKCPIISVHTPKAAGTSLLHQLQCIYGEDKVLLDYADDPIDARCRMNIDPDYYQRNPIKTISPCSIVHGHFHVSKYAFLADAKRITFLRHPVDNLISIYRYWSSHDEIAFDVPVFRYFKRNLMKIEEFAMLPAIRFLYSESYFGGVDMNQFDFIGDYHSLEEELVRLGKLLCVDFGLDVRINVTSERDSNERQYIDHSIRPALGHILERDVRFYERHVGR